MENKIMSKDKQKEAKYYQDIRVPWFSKSHPITPKFYVQPWTQDIVNRSIIIHNANKGGIPTYEHDDALYLNNREQLKYNMQNRKQVDSKYELPSREEMMNPKMHESAFKYKSFMMSRFHN